MDKSHIEQRILVPRKPHICIVYLLDNCFMRCKMCMHWKENYPTANISCKEWEHFFFSLKNFVGPIEVALVGGEPLIHKDIFDLAKIISNLGFIAAFTSNGYLINRPMARRIIESNFKKVTLSLDSLDSLIHDYLRSRQGSHERILNAVKYLQGFNNNLEIKILTIIMEKNIDEIIPLLQYIQENNAIKGIHFQAIVQPFGEAQDEYWFLKDKYKELWPQDINKTLNVLDSLIKFKESGYKIGNSVSQLRAFKEYFNNPKDFIRKDRICNSIDFGIFVHYYGKIYLCNRYDSIGDIYHDFKEVYFSDKAQEIRKQIISCKKNCHFLVNCNYED